MEPLKSDVDIQTLINDAWLNISCKEHELFNPLSNIPKEFETDPHIYLTYLMMQPEYFSFLCNHILNVKCIPFQALLLKILYEYKFPMFIASRGGSKSFLLAVYCIIRALTLPGRKIVIAGSTFRQSKIVFEYMEKIWYNAPILRDICGKFPHSGPSHLMDMWRFYLGDSVVTAIPVGPTGDNVRGLRANDLIAEEFKSHDRQIFETVLAGFGAVSADPVENVQRIASEKMAKNYGIKLEPPETDTVSNQLIISGTAYYQFNHFYDYWKQWRSIILNKKRDLDNNFKIDHKDYCIIRLPIELIPDGFMDQAQIARSKATMHSGNFQCEYGAVFSTDSNGFFKRSMIESCTVSEDKNISFPSCGKVMFYPTLVGNQKLSYVIGVDPASEGDNFAITVLELHPDHRRIVYAWTINKQEQKARLAEGQNIQTDYFGFCARKIRNLMKVFPTRMIGIDSQGGGYAIIESLLRTDEPGDVPIYEIIEHDNPKDTDRLGGLHIVNKIQFANADWMSQSNNSLRLALENKMLLFPHHDSLTNTFAAFADTSNNLLYDTLEDCIGDIEELKDELATIIMTNTDTGKDKWTTPDKKEPGMKKGKMRKDRYTALLIAHAVADYLEKSVPNVMYTTELGGFASRVPTHQCKGNTYSGPAHIVDKMKDLYD